MVLCLWGALLTAPLRAQAEPPSKSVIALSEVHFRAGAAYYARQRFVEAAQEFEEAYRLSGISAILFDMASAYDSAGALPKARDAYRRFQNAQPQSESAAFVKARLTELDREISTLELREVHGSTVRLDGVVLAGEDLTRPIELNPGAHVVEAVRSGYPVFDRRLLLAPGAHDAITIDWAPPSKRPLYKKWWLWTAVGGVVVGTVVVGAVLGTRTGDPSSRLPAIQ